MVRHDVAHDGESESCPASTCREVRQEEIVPIRRVDTVARVFDNQPHHFPSAVHLRTNGNRAHGPTVECLDCVVDEVHDDASHLLDIEMQ